MVRHDVEYVEQPVAGDLAALARLRSSVGVKIAADEDVADAGSAAAVIVSAAADVIVIKPVALGGIGPSWRLMQAAKAAGLGVTVTTGIETGVGTAAALHLAAALGGEGAAGLATLDLLESSLVRERLVIEGGSMVLPPGPGLGVSLDERALSRYATRERRLGER